MKSAARKVVVRLDGREYDVALDDHRATVNGRDVFIDSVVNDGAGGIVIHSGPRQFRVVLDVNGEEIRAMYGGREFSVEHETERHRLLQRFAAQGIKAHARADIRASMPGLVVRVKCQAGSEVKKGQALVILEAMKMENEIRAPIDGVVKEVRVSQGLAVEKGDVLVVLD